jgi:hypothetical protein
MGLGVDNQEKEALHQASNAPGITKRPISKGGIRTCSNPDARPTPAGHMFQVLTGSTAPATACQDRWNLGTYSRNVNV